MVCGLCDMKKRICTLIDYSIPFPHLQNEKPQPKKLIEITKAKPLILNPFVMVSKDEKPNYLKFQKNLLLVTQAHSKTLKFNFLQHNNNEDVLISIDPKVILPLIIM